jgi:hypothetical protein
MCIDRVRGVRRCLRTVPRRRLRHGLKRSGILWGELKRRKQALHRVAIRLPAASFQLLDAVHTQPRQLGKRFLRQPSFQPVLSEQIPK